MKKAAEGHWTNVTNLAIAVSDAGCPDQLRARFLARGMGYGHPLRGLRDGQPTLPTPRASRSPVATPFGGFGTEAHPSRFALARRDHGHDLLRIPR
jgi:hypothetical protein